jgi:hypothetical protein
MASITLTWTASDTATGGTPTHYDIYRALGDATEQVVDDSNNKIAEVVGTVLTYDDSNVAAGSSYSYTVIARNAGGSSAPADNITAKNILA